MKRKQVTLAVLLAALSFFAAPSTQAVSSSQVLAIKKAVADVPAAELAATAAGLVRQSARADREEVAVLTVREVASQRPAAVVAVVGSVAKAAPEVSPAVAGEAAKLVAERSSEIARAAAASAPAQADKIAAAVAKVTPRSAKNITRAVVTVVPDQSSRVVETVLASVPSATTEIRQDTTISRITQRASSGNGDGGIFTTRQGTINGTPPPNTPPTSEQNPVAGADPERAYASPTPH